MSGQWASGVEWRYTIYHPVLVWGVQGEFVYLGVLLIIAQTWFMFKIILALLILALIGAAMGFGFRQLYRRFNRWRLAGSRPVLNVQDNIHRMTRGF